MNKKEFVILRHLGFIIRRHPYGYIFHHESDKKLRHAVYPGSLEDSLKHMHERVLLSKTASEGYDGSIEAFRQALIETHKEFKALLSPRIVGILEEERE